MYLEIDEGFTTHRKTLRFCGFMQDHNAFAYLMRLWSWATRSAPDGDLSGLDPIDIELAVQYRLGDGKCYRAMVVAGFIDTDGDGAPVMIHNWPKRTGGAIARMEAAALAAKARKDRWKERQQNGTGTPEERSENASGTFQNGSRTPQDKTSPDQSRPDQKAPARPRDPWPAWHWFEKFKLSWAPAHGQLAYGSSVEDDRATGDFNDTLNTLPGEQRVAAEEAADELFARYFAIKQAAGHPWKWFCQRFNELRLPKSRGSPRNGSAPPGGTSATQRAAQQWKGR